MCIRDSDITIGRFKLKIEIKVVMLANCMQIQSWDVNVNVTMAIFMLSVYYVVLCLSYVKNKMFVWI